MTTPLDYTLNLQTVASGYDRKTCWVQTRAGVIPPTTAVITTQKLRLTGSDIFYAIHDLRSDDGGATWTEPAEQLTLGRKPRPDGTEVCPCDGTPTWHAATGKLLATGHTAVYRDDDLVHGFRPRATWYSVYDATARRWGEMRSLDMPGDRYVSAGAGCTQRVDLPDGDILLPIYFRDPAEAVNEGPMCAITTVVRCRFDGESLCYAEHGDELAIETPRGLCEPSLARFGRRFFLTLRNDEKGYVTSGPDGLHFDAPRPWAFDDGAELGNYNTQQHWVTHSDGLFLVYTRRGADNDHVFRHRAPLFMARVDPDRLCVVRETERVVVPERGARLGNFGTANVSSAESWVIVSEWMQTKGPNPCDSTVCEQYGSDNSIFIGRIRWDRPNRRVAW